MDRCGRRAIQWRCPVSAPMEPTAAQVEAHESINASEVRPGMFLRSADTDLHEVRHVEPSDDGNQVLLVFAGGTTEWYGALAEVELTSAAEVIAARKRLADRQKRAKVLDALERLVELVRQGLPLPAYFDIDASLMPSADAVRQAAEILGETPVESLNSGAPQIQFKHHFGADENSRVVEMRMWHLGRRPAPADEPGDGA